MASIDTVELDWNPESDKQKLLELEQGIEHVIIDNESLAVQELFTMVNELSKKINVIYDQCVVNFKIKDNPFEKV